MSDLLSEPRISLTALASREDKHVSTAWRWCLSGVKGHILESFVVGRKRYTTIPAFERWIAQLNGKDALPSQPSHDRESAIEQAEREFDEILERKKRRDAEGGNSPPPAAPQ